MSLFQGWTMPIQQASYNGVMFDVVSIDDQLERAVIEHTYPFVNGADLESMGLNPQTVRLSAVFFGDGYFSQFKALLKALESNKPAVLVHPIRGRMPQMLCVFANFNHNADDVNYATLELQFKEASEMQPIFVFENSVLTAVDSAFSKVNSYLDKAMDYYSVTMEAITAGLSSGSRVIGMWQIIYSVYESIRDLFGADKNSYTLMSGVTASTLSKQSNHAVEDLVLILNNGLTELSQISRQSNHTSSTISQRLLQGRDNSFIIDSDDDDENPVSSDDVFNIRSRFDAVLDAVDIVINYPRNLVKGVEKAPTAAQVAARLKNSGSATIQSYSLGVLKSDAVLLECVLRVACAGVVAKIATQLIEEVADDILPSEVEYLCTKTRLLLLDALNTVRALQKQDESTYLNAPMNNSYMNAQVLSESLRDVAHAVTRLSIAAINQKPPLIVRIVEKTGTMQQQAHWLYGDYTRSNELLRLNAHIRYPNFIEKGTVLNSYAI